MRAALDFDAVTFDSPTSAVSLEGLGGRLNWYDDASRTALAGTIDDDRFQSRLGLESGPALGTRARRRPSLPFATTGRHFRLLEPVVLPVFDGGLAIDTLRVRHAGTDEMYVRFDAELRPISVALLSRAFGWPEFQGTLEGSIPGLQLRQGVVTLDGALEARVFDGRVVGARAPPAGPARDVSAPLREHRHRGPRPRARHAHVRVRLDHRPAVGLHLGPRDLRLDAGGLRRLPLHAAGRPRRSIASASARSRTCPASAAAAAAASPRRCRAGSCASSTTTATTGSASPAGSRTTSASWAACCRRPAATTS